MDKKRFDLQLFAEEGASAATDEAAAAAEPTAAGAEAVGQDQQPAQEQKASFNDLLKDDQYKREYDKRVEGAVRRRMRAADAKLAKMDPMFDVLAKKYGIGRGDDGKLDMNALQTAIMSDDTLLEEQAAEEGLTPEGMRKVMRAEQIERSMQAQQAEQENMRLFAAIQEEAEALKAVYPDFDLDAEIGDERFGSLLISLQRAGVDAPLRTAYEVAHRQELLQRAVNYTAAKARQDVAASVQSNLSRPREMGSSGAPAQSNFDPEKMTKKDYEAIKAKVSRGGRVSIEDLRLGRF